MFSSTLLMLLVAVCIVTAAAMADAKAPLLRSLGGNNYQQINWTAATTASICTATLQMVTNPLVASSAGNISRTAFRHLKQMKPTYARYAPWFPFPQWGVAEQHPPQFPGVNNNNNNNCTTSWDFSGMLSQLLPFMDSVGTNSVWMLSTYPIWIFSSATSSNSICNYTDDWSCNKSSTSSPSSAGECYMPSWCYASTGVWNYNSSAQIASYLGRVVSYLLTGTMIDECGNTISGGPAFLVRDTALSVVIEPQNEWEAEWQAKYQRGPLNTAAAAQQQQQQWPNADFYVATYDMIVSSVKKALETQPQSVRERVRFQALANSGHCEWDVYRTFFNLSLHEASVRGDIAGGFASFHAYAQPSERTRDRYWEHEMFDTFEDFAEFEVPKIVAIRDEMQSHLPPHKRTRLSSDEMGVILPDDNTQGAAPIPPAYWNAAAAVYAYAFAKLSPLLNVAGESQYAGTSAGYPAGNAWPQYPSVSEIQENGEPTARYHALNMLLQHNLSEDRASSEIFPSPTLPARPVLCAARWNSNPFNVLKNGMAAKTIELRCANPASKISSILSARVGDIYDTDVCYKGNASKQGISVLHDPHIQACIGSNNCTIELSIFWDYALFSNHDGNYRLVVTAVCDGNGGGFAIPSGFLGDRVFVQARMVSTGPKQAFKRKLIVVNKNRVPAPLELPPTLLKGASMTLLDAPFLPPREIVKIEGQVTLGPFAFAVVTLAW